MLQGHAGIAPRGDQAGPGGSSRDREGPVGEGRARRAERIVGAGERGPAPDGAEGRGRPPGGGGGRPHRPPRAEQQATDAPCRGPRSYVDAKARAVRDRAAQDPGGSAVHDARAWPRRLDQGGRSGADRLRAPTTAAEQEFGTEPEAHLFDAEEGPMTIDPIDRPRDLIGHPGISRPLARGPGPSRAWARRSPPSRPTSWSSGRPAARIGGPRASSSRGTSMGRSRSGARGASRKFEQPVRGRTCMSSSRPLPTSTTTTSTRSTRRGGSIPSRWSATRLGLELPFLAVATAPIVWACCRRLRRRRSQPPESAPGITPTSIPVGPISSSCSHGAGRTGN